MRLHAVRSVEELQAALVLAQRLLGFSDDHRGGFVDYYLSRYPECGRLQVVAEEQGGVYAVVLGSVQDDHILVGEVAVEEAYWGRGVGSRLLRLMEQEARGLGYHRFLLGAKPEAYGFYLKNGYAPLLWLRVEDSGVEELEWMLQNELRSYLLIWEPGVWKEDERQGVQLALQVSLPDEMLCKRIEQGVPTCQADYLFIKGYEPVSANSISLVEVRDRER